MRKFLSLCSLMLVLQACTEPGDTTAVGAASGGAVGAGLGAIVGSTSGDAGTGLVLGAALGAATGGMVGNGFEAQEKRLREQDQQIQRTQVELRRNQMQIEDLRRLQRGDPDVRARIGYPTEERREMRRVEAPPAVMAAIPAPTPRVVPEVIRATAPVPEIPPVASVGRAKAVAPSRDPADDTFESRDISTRDITEQAAPEVPQPRIPELAKAEKSEVPAEASARINGNNLLQPAITNQEETAECKKAAEEVAHAAEATDIADQLFRYRRALRWCPQRADYHLKLADVYRKLGRKEDAEYETKEAQKIDASVAVNERPAAKPDRY